MLLSIILPVYKVEKYLDDCVKSVISQSFDNYEIILVDDGSPDKCGTMCDFWSNANSKIRTIHKKNGGLSDARNAGINAAKGDYLMFLDSDDSLLENSLQNIANIIKSHRPQVVAGTYFAFEEKSNAILFGPDGDFSNNSEVMSSQDICRLFKQQNISPCAWRYVLDRQFVLDKQLFFEKGLLSEDAVWTPRMICEGKSFVLNPVPFYRYLVREGSIMTSFNFKKVTDVMTICEKNYLYAEDTDILQKSYINNLNFLVMANTLKEYNAFSKDQKHILSVWFKTNKNLVSDMLRSKAEAYTASRLIGDKNAMMLVAWAIKAKSLLANVKKYS
ncbi:MAG: glycosyltransferase family 2 protein [Oscillospiraceae bacterium]